VSCPHDYENADYCPQCQDEAAGAWARSQEGRDSLRAAYERGAAAMREAIVALVEKLVEEAPADPVYVWGFADGLVDAIRDLPLTPPPRVGEHAPHGPRREESAPDQEKP
jgi:hypothetical protein